MPTIPTLALPDTLPDLIATAVSAGRSLDRERYLPLWYCWHEPSEESDGDHVHIDLVGALMAVHLGARPDQYRTPAYYDNDVEVHCKMAALSEAAAGKWELASMLVANGNLATGHATDDAVIVSSVPNPTPPPAYRRYTQWDEFDLFLTTLSRRADIIRQCPVERADEVLVHSAVKRYFDRQAALTLDDFLGEVWD